MHVVAVNWFLIGFIGLAVVAGIIILLRALTSPSGQPWAWAVVGLLMAGVLFVFIGYSTAYRMTPANVAIEAPKASSLESIPNPEVFKPLIDLSHESNPSEPSAPPVKEPASTATPAEKPVWLTKGLQTGNGTTQFVVSSELHETVAQCHQDLDRIMATRIEDQIMLIAGVDYPIDLLPGEAQSLIAEIYTEEYPIASDKIWYRIHRLIKIDQAKWASFRLRFQQAQLQARVVQMVYALGGLMLVIGVVYLVLRRKPSDVDPTLNTFSTT